ncbi:S-adenosyl-L-methionine-dependent methyltransferase [Rhodococcus sp. 1163]|uniref:YceI family protein n=1 Tax=unclassified Rhodococcus (in: high G+C Gram-positive bacteria) TaxID=192944 RepID=UPI000A041C52|nr:YceI family protein [Rhodococcus sp. 1163]ORI19428.1 S-adenosyl-L-methionine-dependent methyltransferase [Rhodococcus sp. 1163]
MTPVSWTLDASGGGHLTIKTDVTGKASKLGHRLTIAMKSWTAAIDWSGHTPTSVTFTAEVDSLDVVGGEGGVTPLIGPEKMLAKSNALKTFDAKRYPQIRFRSDDIAAKENGFALRGTMEIHGVTREMTVIVIVADDGTKWHCASESTVRQSDYGIKPYSQMLGAMKVVDEVTVSFEAERTKPSLNPPKR